MKKAFKIIGIILGSILGLLGIATAVAAIGGAFSNKRIDITELSWETDKVRVVDDYKTTINFLPENANQLDVELKLVYADGANIVEIPSTVKAGQEFTIKLKKDANGNNIGGEVVIEAKTKLVVSKTKLKILVDVPIPNNGLVLASDFDSEDDDKLINAGSSQFGLYVYTNPNLALNSNTGKETDLIESYKDITIKSGNESALQIITSLSAYGLISFFRQSLIVLVAIPVLRDSSIWLICSSSSLAKIFSYIFMIQYPFFIFRFVGYHIINNKQIQYCFLLVYLL